MCLHYFAEITPEVVAEMFYNGELELELHRIGLEDYRFKLDSDRKNCFERVEEARRVSLYPHPHAVFPRMQGKRLVKI